MNKVILCAVPVCPPSSEDDAVIANMPEIRRARYMSAKNPDVRAQLIAAQKALDGALHALLPDYTPPADFGYLPDGRPYVSGAHVSISHTSTLAICAASHIPVGVDVENSARNIRPAMAERILYPGEKNPRGLLGTWVDKEAYLKLTGQGLSGGMDTFLVQGNAVCAPSGMQLAYIARPEIDSHIVSVCCHGEFSIIMK